MRLRRFFTASSRRLASPARPSRTQLQIENLESRLTPYSVSGNAWAHPELITLSFQPDGTNLGGVTSNLFSTMNARWATSVWQREILRAAQVWAQVTNLNFTVVNDNGTESGGGVNQQGDPNFGDVRIGAYNAGGSNLGSAMMPPPVNNYSVAGDFTLNSGQPWAINQTGGYDLFTVAAHEIGHSLGLYHSTVSTAEEFSFYNATKNSLRPDDIAGVRAIYSGGLGRAADANDAVLSNGSFANATSLTAQIDPQTQTALVQNLDLTTTGDHDYYSFQAPQGTTGNLTVKVQSAGLSMLMPTVTVYNASQQQVGFASGAGQYGSTLSVNVGDVTAGQLFYVKVSPAETTAFGTGKYALALNFGSGAAPTVPLPNTLTANGSPIQGGGGIANRDGYEEQVNTTSDGTQLTYTDVANRNANAMNGWGMHLVTWSAQNQDGDGSGVFGRLYGPDGIAWTGEFQINTHARGDQLHAVAALDDVGNFVVAWASQGQDADGSWGIYAQRFDYFGLPIGEEFAIADGLGDQKYPAIGSASDGRFVITWADAALDGDGWGVSARLYDTGGKPITEGFVVNSTVTGDQTQSGVAMDVNGNFVVVWTNPEAGGANVYGKLYDAAGAVVKDEFLLNSNTAGLQDNPAVAMADDGDFVATWSSWGQDGSGWGVYAQRFTLEGLPRDSEFRVNSSVGGDQWFSAVAMLANGEAVITWTAVDAAGLSAGIFAQQFSAAGVTVGSEITVNSTQTGNQWFPSVAASDTDGFAVVWSGQGQEDLDGVYVQRYQVQGGGGVANGEDDFYGISEHGNGCGCNSCLGAILGEAAPATEDGAVAQAFVTDELATPSVPTTPVAATAAELPKTTAPTTMPPRDEGMDLVLAPSVRMARSTLTAEFMPPTATETEVERTNPETPATAATAADEVRPLRDSWSEALDSYFAEQVLEPARSSAAEPATDASDFGGIEEGTTPLVGMGLVLGSLWAVRPEPTRGQSRKEKDRLTAGKN